jgi:hypothetical protein
MTPHRLVLTCLLLILAALPLAASSGAIEFAYPRGEEYGLTEDQAAVFPTPLVLYEDTAPSLWGQLKERAMAQHGFNLVATIIFLCAIVHTFLVNVFKEWAHLHEVRHLERIEREGRRAVDKPEEDARDDVSFRANLFHFLGEVEVVFGIWVLALGGAILWFFGFREQGVIEGLN